MSNCRRLKVRLYPTAEAKRIKGKSNESISNCPYPKLTLNDARRSIERFKEKKRNRRALVRQGVNPEHIPPNVFFCNEHDVTDKLGDVKDVYINEKDNWVWADIKTYPHTTDRVNKYIKNQRIKGVSLGYLLPRSGNDYKEIQEVSLTSNPDFVNSKIKVTHSTLGDTLYQNLTDGPFPAYYYRHQKMETTSAPTEPIPTLTPDDFDTFSPEEKQQFLQRSLELEAKEESLRKQKEEEDAQANLSAQAEQHYEGVNTLLSVLNTDDEKKVLVGDRMMNEAINNPLFASTIKMADAAIKLEQERVEELAQKNRELMEQMTSLQKNAEIAAIQNARISGGFQVPVKVGHSSSQMAASSSSSSTPNLFSLVRKRVTRPVSTKVEHSATSSSSSSSSSSLSAPPVPTKVEHSVTLPEGFKYVEPNSGFCLADVFKPRDYSGVPESEQIRVTHSAKKGVEPTVLASTKSSANELSTELIAAVLHDKRDFGDAWHGQSSLRNSLIYHNPKAFAQIIGSKNYLGFNLTNRDEGIHGWASPTAQQQFTAPDDPSGNPFYRRDPAYIERYHVSREEFGTKRLRTN